MGPVMLYLILAVMKFKKKRNKKNSEQIEESAEECHFKNKTLHRLHIARFWVHKLLRLKLLPTLFNNCWCKARQVFDK